MCWSVWVSDERHGLTDVCLGKYEFCIPGPETTAYLRKLSVTENLSSGSLGGGKLSKV